MIPQSSVGMSKAEFSEWASVNWIKMKGWNKKDSPIRFKEWENSDEYTFDCIDQAGDGGVCITSAWAHEDTEWIFHSVYKKTEIKAKIDRKKVYPSELDMEMITDYMLTDPDDEEVYKFNSPMTIRQAHDYILDNNRTDIELVYKSKYYGPGLSLLYYLFHEHEMRCQRQEKSLKHKLASQKKYDDLKDQYDDLVNNTMTLAGNKRSLKKEQ